MAKEEVKVIFQVGVDILECDVTTLEVRDGDTVVICTEVKLSSDVQILIHEQIKSLFPNNRVLILESGMKIGVMRKIESALKVN